MTIPDIVPPIPLVPGQPKSIKRKPTATVSQPPQSQNEPPTKHPKVKGKASANPAAKLPKGPLGKDQVLRREKSVEIQNSQLKRVHLVALNLRQGQQIVLINLVCFDVFIATDLTIISSNYMDESV